MKKFSISIVLIASALLLSSCSHQSDNDNNNKNKTKHAAQTKNSDNNQKKHKKVVKDGRTYADGILIVNKEHALPSSYNPGENPEAQKSVTTIIR